MADVTDEEVDLVWLADQIERYPERVRPGRTCNIGTLHRLAAQELRKFEALLAERRKP